MSRRRMFYNDDGDSNLMGYTGPFRPEMITDSVDAVVGTPITTFVLCAIGTDPVSYPSAVASQYGWRRTDSDRTSPVYRRWYEVFQFVRQQNWDIPQMVLERARQKGLEFIPSMRMNDLHFCQKVPPEEHPLTGEWYLKHKHLIIEPGHPWSRDAWPYLAPDFTHQEVRDFRVAVANEMIDRYAGDGFEMDWTRHPFFFPEGKARPELITDMVRQVRRRLDERGAREGRHLTLVARVAASIEDSLKIGLDAPTWVKERLVDCLAPSSPSRYVSLDMPIREWMDLVSGTSIEVHPSPDSAAWCGNGQAPLEMYRAAASNYYRDGAHGIYIFNLFCRGFPLADDAYVILRDLADPAGLERRDKVFCSTPDNWNKQTDTLPVDLNDPGRAAQVNLLVGDDLRSADEATRLHRATLGVRLAGCTSEDRVQVCLNGKAMDMGRAQLWASQNRQPSDVMPAPGAQWERTGLQGPFARLRFDLAVDELPKLGDNLVTVRVLTKPAADRGFKLVLADVYLEVTYDYCGKGFTAA